MRRTDSRAAGGPNRAARGAGNRRVPRRARRSPMRGFAWSRFDASGSVSGGRWPAV
ncbi:hypothetical protein BURCENK562V_C4769 [Burkholderia cenocepacia K56-2Valvano]|nr:hypothetical protein BURCENK562V_C4769 [Burkholderia cenocepacia K56-2Valvano]